MKYLLFLAKYRIQLFAVLLLTTIQYGAFFQQHYGPDSYSVFFRQAEAFPKNVISLGRPFHSLQAWLASQFDISLIEDQQIFIIATVLTLSLAIVVFWRALLGKQKPNTAKSWLSLGAWTLAVNNIFFLGLFAFPESIFNASLGLLAVAIACTFYAKATNWKGFAYAVGFVALSTLFYQSWMYVFAIFVAIFELKRSSVVDWKRLFFGFFAVGAALFANFSAILIGTRILEVESLRRTGGLGLFRSGFDRFIDVFRASYEGTFSMWPPRLFILLTVLGFGFALYLLMNKRGWKDSVLVLGATGVAAMMLPFIPVIVSENGSVSGRVLIASGFLLAIPALALLNAKSLNLSKINIEIVGVFVLSIMGLNILSSVIIGSQHTEASRLDQEQARQIVDEINQYEAANDTKIRRVQFVDDKERTSCRIQGRCFAVMTHSSFFVPWNQVSLLNYMNGGLRFARTPSESPLPAAVERAMQKDFKTFDLDRQLFFEDTTAYVVNY